MSIGSVVNAAFRITVIAVVLAGCASGPESNAQAIRETLQQAAAAAEADGDYANAAGQYQTLYDRRPDDLASLLGLARNLRYSGRAKLAVEAMDKAADRFAGQTAFLVERGKANVAAGNVSAAIGFLTAARDKDGGNWEIHAALGIAYDLTEKFDRARESYGRALQLSKDNPVILNNMAISAALAGDIDRAIATLEHAPVAARNSPQVRQNLALFYGIKGDMEKAEALARMDLDEAAVRNNLAVFSRLRAGQPQPASPKAK